MPEGRQVVGQSTDLGFLCGRQGGRGLMLEAREIFLGLGHLGQGFIPLAFQLPGHQAMFGFDGLVLAAGPVSLFLGPLDFQLGLAEAEVGLRLELVQRGQGQVDLGGGQGRQEEPFDLGIDPVSADGLADRGPLVLVGAIAAIDGVLAVGTAIMHAHPLATTAAADQALQEGLAGPFQAPAAGLEALLIGRQTVLVGQVLVP